MSIKAARHEAARQFTIPPDCISDKDFAAALGLSEIIVAPTGLYDEHDREQVVSVRFTPSLSLGNAAGNLLVLEGMAATDDPTRLSVGAHGLITLAAVRQATKGELMPCRLAVGNPGVADPKRREAVGDDQTYELVKEQYEDLREGDFSSVSRAVHHAAKFVMDKKGLSGLPVHRLAPSLDSSNASAGIGLMVESGMDLRTVSLIDPMGLAADRGGKRLLQFLSVDPKPYLAGNHPSHRSLVENTRQWFARSGRSLSANLTYGLRGVSLGGAASDLYKSAQTLVDNKIALRVYAAGLSEFNTVPSAQAVVDSLAERGVDVKLEVIENASHGMTQSVGPYVLALVQRFEESQRHGRS